MDSHVRRRGAFSGEIGSAVRAVGGLAYFPYIIRTAENGAVLFDGCAGDLQEAVQTVDLYLDYLTQEARSVA